LFYVAIRIITTLSLFPTIKLNIGKRAFYLAASKYEINSP